MSAATHQSFMYIGLAGEGDYIGEGGLYRYTAADDTWQSITKGLPEQPQVRALLRHPEHPDRLFAGTQAGLYRSDDRGDHWEALDAPRTGMDVWSLTAHPHDPNVLFAGYEPCAIYRSEDGGTHWQHMNTDEVVFPHITTVMPPLCKRVIDLAIDPSNPMDMYAAIEVGGLLVSRDGGDHWHALLDGPYVRNNTLDLHAVQVSAAAPGTVHIATQIAMFCGRDRGKHWEQVQVEDMFPGGSYCRDLLVDPADPRTLYLAAGAGGGGAPAGTVEAGALFRSRDLGETWERIDLGDIPPSRMGCVAIDPAVASRIACCAQRGQVYLSEDHGQTWRYTQVPVELSRQRHIYAMIYS
ncbi:MAG TPA: hypothetical protein VIG57_00025 [Candidatus Entotheonella sp.]